MARKYTYQTEVWHDGLNKYRVVKASNRRELQQKVNTLKAEWDEQWQRKVEKEMKKQHEMDSVAYALELSIQAEEEQQYFDELLVNHINIKPFDLNKLKDFSAYQEVKPEDEPLLEIPLEPQIGDNKYQIRPSLFSIFSKKKREEIEALNKRNFEQDHALWEKSIADLREANEEIQKMNRIKREQWEIRRDNFKAQQARKNKDIDDIINGFSQCKPKAVEAYITKLLENIDLPFNFKGAIEAEYDPDSKRIILDVFLPTINDLPRLKSVNYIKSRDEFKETYYSDSYVKSKYNDIIYQIVLIIFNHVFQISSQSSLINYIVLNGRIHTVDLSTGKKIKPCILTVNVGRKSFEELNLFALDPETWFRSVKGISAVSLAHITPVAPILEMSQKDKRFVEGYSVADRLDDSINLAAMDWQDFENLIREIFEKEFSINGGKVKITQASRDGGVDAIAFDPDPIRGGKIVIQAKRYTNVVSVSAVRDLYGTVVNEGATKGILVTTSGYGHDAYDFAKGKPLTLLTGAHLLHLLEKHGYSAKIDINEAKRILKNKK
ncbi:restriction endonuclease [Anaerotignum lactatifermentans]|uniref:Restriction system protein n=1 Tax=Anaerotignum lactatifermentans DSM 14214 TaxID=1121323 RepID=A0A1M6N7G1_9FIRM|nr:restriction endonuclease [Anaerotignum lactatifermentans]SHJ91534.1 restriction system protein [[Clostridium] lactatifermentans DSM 14214] [Anaerotignum lactatifermentans DSM 14214]